MTESGARLIEILLIEDNPGDVILTQEAFKSANIGNNIEVVVDGEQALDYLHKRGSYAEAKTPDIILLDLNIPKKDGREVLEEIKQDQHLRRIPIVILTSSKAENDVAVSYGLHANCYMVKPPSLESFRDIVGAIENFWFSIVVLPSESATNLAHDKTC
jgi:CheY-like chemotaxis protein